MEKREKGLRLFDKVCGLLQEVSDAVGDLVRPGAGGEAAREVKR